MRYWCPWEPGVHGILGSMGTWGPWDPPSPACTLPQAGRWSFVGPGRCFLGDALREGAGRCFSPPAREQRESAVGRKAVPPPPPPLFKRERSPRAWLLQGITPSSCRLCLGVPQAGPPFLHQGRLPALPAPLEQRHNFSVPEGTWGAPPVPLVNLHGRRIRGHFAQPKIPFAADPGKSPLRRELPSIPAVRGERGCAGVPSSRGSLGSALGVLILPG